MRILFGPSSQSLRQNIAQTDPACRHEFIGFGAGSADISYSAGEHTFDDILRQLPSNWSPDVVLFNSPEYEPIPRGIESAECLTVAAIGDWNLGGQAVQLAGSMFDLLVSDRNGCDALRGLGFENVLYAPLFSYDADKVYRIGEISDSQRDLDIVMLGNFHSEIQRERAPWVARVASLSDKHRVLMACSIYGAEYARTMNRAKIVFNRSIRGEINMRVYEAAVCGALMFYERENREIREVFADRVNCVLYGDDDLENLFDYYLAHEDERRSIAQAGAAVAELHSRSRKAVDLANRIEPAISSFDGISAGSARKFSKLPDPEQRRRRAYQWTLMPNAATLHSAVDELGGESQTSQMDPIGWIANTRGCALVQWASTSASTHVSLLRQAVAQFRRALQSDPGYVAARLNLGHTLLLLGLRAEAVPELESAAAELRLGASKPTQLMGPYIPRNFCGSDVEIERQWGLHVCNTTEWTAAMAGILLWRAIEILGEIAFSAGRFADALALAEEEVRAAGDRGPAHYHKARALRAVGRADESVAAYRKAIELSPLSLNLRTELARLLIDIGGIIEARDVITAARAIVAGAPTYESLRPELDYLWQLAEEKSAAAEHDGREPYTARMIAFPDWSYPGDWKRLVSAYVSEFTPSDSIDLCLRVEPGRGLTVDQVVADIESFASSRLGLTLDEMPDITLLTEPFAPEDRWKMFRSVDLLVSCADSAENVYAESRGLPVIAIDSIGSVRDLVPHAKIRRSDRTLCLST